MKKIKFVNRISNLFILLLLIVVLFSSCLKNGNYYTDFSSVGASVDLPLAAANNNGIVSFSFDATVSSTQIPIYANLASPSPLGTAVTVTLALDTAFLNSYNDNNGTSYEPMPDSVYSLSKGFNLSIPAGKRLDSTVATFDFTKMDLSQTYVLPITIQSASVPIEQWNHLLLFISVKNQYDGVYTITGSYSDVSNPAFTGVYPYTWDLVTTGPNQCAVYDNVNLGAPGFVFNTGTALSYYGDFGLLVNFDPTTNAITSVSNYYGTPPNTRAAALDPSGINAYDPSTKVINIKYYMIQPSVISTPPYIRCYFNETWTYSKAR